MGHDSVMHPIYACDDHKMIGVMKQEQDSGFDDFKERMRLFREKAYTHFNSHLA